MITRKEAIQKVEQIICTDREQQYGTPENNFATIAKLWNAYLGRRNEISPSDVAMMMVLLKVARISNGNYKEDSYIDLAGYALCGAEIASMEEEG